MAVGRRTTEPGLGTPGPGTLDRPGARSTLLGALAAAAVLATAAGCATTVGGTALPVTGLDTSPPSTSASASSTTSRSGAASSTTRRTSATRTTLPVPTGPASTGVDCTLVQATVGPAITAVNAYFDAVAATPPATAEKTAAVAATQVAGGTLTTYPYSDPTLGGQARAAGTALQNVGTTLGATTDSTQVNAAVDGFNTAYDAVKTTCAG